MSSPRFSSTRSSLRVPGIGTTKLHRLEENLGAANIELTSDDLAEIERAAAEIHVEGERYPEHLMKTTGR